MNIVKFVKKIKWSQAGLAVCFSCLVIAFLTNSPVAITLYTFSLIFLLAFVILEWLINRRYK